MSIVANEPTRSSQAWQQEITLEQRSVLAHKIIKTLLEVVRQHPTLNVHSYLGDFIKYSIQMEFEVYTSVDNLDSYFHSLAERIYYAQKRLKELPSPIANINLFHYLTQQPSIGTTRAIDSSLLSVTKRSRKRSIRQIIVTILTPRFDRKQIEDINLAELVKYAKQIESKLYQKSKTREEYFRLLTQYIYKTENFLKQLQRAQHMRILKSSLNSYKYYLKTFSRD